MSRDVLVVCVYMRALFSQVSLTSRVILLALLLVGKSVSCWKPTRPVSLVLCFSFSRLAVSSTRDFSAVSVSRGLNSKFPGTESPLCS
jgi:hypothetical protein